MGNRAKRIGVSGFFVVLCCLLSGLTVRAELIEVDFRESGDGLLTRDTQTQLDWLDLSLTRNLSVERVRLGYGGYMKLGFRYATIDEVRALFIAAGIPDEGDTTEANYPATEFLVGLLGRTYTNPNGAYGAKGLTDLGLFDQIIYPQAGKAKLHLGMQATPMATADAGYDVVKTEAEFPDTGSFLIRPVDWCGQGEPYPAGDITRNCIVNMFDLVILVEEWLSDGCVSPTYCNGADLDEDGYVNLRDLRVFADDWMACLAPQCQ